MPARAPVVEAFSLRAGRNTSVAVQALHREHAQSSAPGSRSVLLFHHVRTDRAQQLRNQIMRPPITTFASEIPTNGTVKSNSQATLVAEALELTPDSQQACDIIPLRHLHYRLLRQPLPVSSPTHPKTALFRPVAVPIHQLLSFSRPRQDGFILVRVRLCSRKGGGRGPTHPRIVS